VRGGIEWGSGRLLCWGGTNGGGTKTKTRRRRDSKIKGRRGKKDFIHTPLTKQNHRQRATKADLRADVKRLDKGSGTQLQKSDLCGDRGSKKEEGRVSGQRRVPGDLGNVSWNQPRAPGEDMQNKL